MRSNGGSTSAPPTSTRASARRGVTSGSMPQMLERGPRADCRAGRRHAPRWRRWSCPASTCCCSTSRPTTWTSTGSTASNPSSSRRRRRWSSCPTIGGSWSAPSPTSSSCTSSTTRRPRYGGGWQAYLDERATAARHATEAYETYRDQRTRLTERARRQREWSVTGERKAAKNPTDNDKFVRRWKMESSEQLASKAKATERAIDRLDAVEQALGGMAAAPHRGSRRTQR